jgi:hypothetical protein
MAGKARKKSSKKTLKLRKKPLTDLPVSRKPAENVKGGERIRLSESP